VQDLLASQETVWKVARWLSNRGNHVTVRALRVRPTVADIGEYGDAGDLEILTRIEVKHRHLMFTAAHDFPFASISVDSVRAWDRAHPKPTAYVILNEPQTVAAIVRGNTARHWERRTLEELRGRPQTWLYCPIKWVVFQPFEGA
jgi:hypothetical protein